MIFWTSDSHFGHSFVAKLRFGDNHQAIKTNDDTIINNWNAMVGRNDHVYHLGDFAWHDLANYRRRLNGHIHLILGNHDRLKGSDRNLFESISDIKQIKVEGQKIVMCHYSFRVWNASHHSSWHLYGHSHGSLKDDPNALSLDVGVDCWDFKPVTFDQIKKKMSKKTFLPVDHHGSE